MSTPTTTTSPVDICTRHNGLLRVVIADVYHDAWRAIHDRGRESSKCGHADSIFKPEHAGAPMMMSTMRE